MVERMAGGHEAARSSRVIPTEIMRVYVKPDVIFNFVTYEKNSITYFRYYVIWVWLYEDTAAKHAYWWP